MGGWLNHYSLRCQPVDYSDNPIANRVSDDTSSNVRLVLCSKLTSLYIDIDFFFQKYTNLYIDTTI